VVEYARLVRDSDFVPLDAPVAPLVCPLLHWIVHVKVSPSGSLMGMLQVKLRGLFIEPSGGEGVPNVGGLSTLVMKVYHFLV
jgi:hypothetical protein